jgi:hypothetical protein
MSLHTWLRNLRPALAPGRGQRRHRRRGPLRAATHRLNVEALEDRSVPAFVAPVDYTVGAYPIGMQPGDFNGDGIPDLATVNTEPSGGGSVSGSVSVLLSNGDGTFQPARKTPALNDPYAAFGENTLAVGDFDRDGNLDLATNGVRVLLGRGDGTFVTTVPPVNFFGVTNSIATGDMNGDGKLDLLETAVDEFNGGTYVAVLLGHGDGTFSPANTASWASGPSEVFSLALADFDRDNKLDLALGGSAATAVLLGNGDGTFREYRAVGPLVGSLTVADFNADGKPDLASAWDSVNVLLGNGDGSFQAARSFTAVGVSVAAADVNGDRAPDLVLEGSYGLGGGSVLLGTGDGNFGPPITTAATGGYLVVADFNGDGRPDEALTGTTSATTVTALFNDGIWDGSPPPPPPLTLRVGDVTVVEGNKGTALAVFLVTLSAPPAQPVTVQYATANGTATAGGDYLGGSGILIIPAGQTGGTITVPVNGDRLGEPDETFFVSLSGATGASIADGVGMGTVADDEPRISISDFTKAEGKRNKTTQFTFTVTLSAAYDQPVTVSFQTVNGTATTGDGDYVANTGTLTFRPGETTKTITIAVKGDSKREANETFFVDLFGNSSNSWFSKERGLGTVLNDD